MNHHSFLTKRSHSQRNMSFDHVIERMREKIEEFDESSSDEDFYISKMKGKAY